MEEVLRVAREQAEVSIDPAALARMGATRTIVDRAIDRGERIYGSTTGVGAAASSALSDRDSPRVSRNLVGAHDVAQGPALPHEEVRAAALLLVNGFASGRPGVRPELAVRYLDALNADDLPEVKSLGSVGEADLAPLANLA